MPLLLIGSSGDWRIEMERASAKNEYEARDWFVKAAQLGNAQAQFELGKMYENGCGAVKKYNVTAADFYKKAAEQGHAEAQYALGSMYMNGLGVRKDERIAAEWFQKAKR